MLYRWQGVSFDVDDGLQDETSLQFHKFEGDTLSASFTATSVDTEIPLPAFVATGLTELKRELDGWSVAEDPVVDEQTGLVELQGPDGLYMVRAFRRSSATRVYCFNATGTKSARASLVKWAKNAAESLKAE